MNESLHLKLKIISDRIVINRLVVSEHKTTKICVWVLKNKVAKNRKKNKTLVW